MKSIEVDIGTDGSVTIDAVGFTGPDCEEATRFLEQALGTAASRNRKPEYRQRAAVQHRQSVGARGRSS